MLYLLRLMGPDCTNLGYNSYMILSSVAQTKNELSAILRRVREGETVIVTDHGKPVAQIVPMAGTDLDDNLQALIREGVVSPPQSMERYGGPTVDLTGRGALSEAVIAERDAGW